MKINYNPKLKSLSRELRNNSTLSEVLLWNKLKARKMRGYQFMRQKPIDEYIVDFYCSELKLIIEIDGESHDGKFEEDMTRQRKLESLGLTVLRVNDLDVKRDMENVLMAIEGWIENNNPFTTPLPTATTPLPPFLRGNNI
ncbi:MAG: endonuclease domain-containing protein [Nitrospirae bacterium]|nr:MAG: endonuclease domain-containing protein [Nitrospirota bacterium]